jgi:hypothetical protein
MLIDRGGAQEETPSMWGASYRASSHPRLKGARVQKSTAAKPQRRDDCHSAHSTPVND